MKARCFTTLQAPTEMQTHKDKSKKKIETQERAENTHQMKVRTFS